MGVFYDCCDWCDKKVGKFSDTKRRVPESRFIACSAQCYQKLLDKTVDIIERLENPGDSGNVNIRRY